MGMRFLSLLKSCLRSLSFVFRGALFKKPQHNRLIYHPPISNMASTGNIPYTNNNSGRPTVQPVISALIRDINNNDERMLAARQELRIARDTLTENRDISCPLTRVYPPYTVCQVPSPLPDIIWLIKWKDVHITSKEQLEARIATIEQKIDLGEAEAENMKARLRILREIERAMGRFWRCV